MEIQKELEYLLTHHWVCKETDREMYYQIKSKLKWIIEFVTNKLGDRLIVNQEIIKLEKVPAKIDESMALKDFDQPLDYVLFLLLLMFLEDKIKGEQFILSNLTEYMNGIVVSLDIKYKPDWNLYRHRKSLVDIMKYALELNIIKVRDGNNNKFAEDVQTDVLYENTGISYYYIRKFNQDITTYTMCEEFLNNDDEEYRVNLNQRRNYIYRSLLYQPVFYFEQEDISNIDYLRNYRNYTSHDMEQYYNANLLVYKNMALISYESSNNKDYYPNSKVLCDIVMVINKELISEYIPNQEDMIELSIMEFRYFLSNVHDKYKEYFSKEYREMLLEKFYQLITDMMCFYSMAKIEHDRIKFYPVIKLFTGDYAKLEEIENDSNQLELLLEDCYESI